MVMPARLVVDGMMYCKGWDGEEHLADYEKDFYSKVNKKKSSLCKACVSKQGKQRRKLARLAREKPVKKNHIKPAGAHATLMMTPFVTSSK